MAQYTLDDLNAALERQFGPTKIGDEIVLLPVLRLSKEKRQALKELQAQSKELSEIKDDDEDIDADAVIDATREKLETMIKIISESESAGYAALKWAGGDLAKLQTIVSIWNKDQKPGEA